MATDDKQSPVETYSLGAQLEIETLRHEVAHLRFELSKANMLLAEHAGSVHRTNMANLTKKIGESKKPEKKNA